MIEIARFARQEGAEALVDALEKEGHNTVIKPLVSTKGFGVYSASEQEAKAAVAFLESWLQKTIKHKQQEAWATGSPVQKQSDYYSSDNALKQWWLRFGWVTKLVFLLTVAAFFMPRQWQDALLFPQSIQYLSTEPWRLITPMFLHFGVMHIAFNLIFWMELGSVIERFQSSQQLLFITVITATVSALAQFYSTGANFGGLSGVVYGLLGYLWLYGKANPHAGYSIRREIVIAMLVWLVFCYIVLPDIVANEAHLFGLISGAVLGAAVGYVHRQRIEQH